MADPNAPDLRIRAPGDQCLTSLESVICQFVVAGLDVNGHDAPVIALFHQRTNLLLVELRAPSCEFLFAVPRMPRRHDSTSLLWARDKSDQRQTRPLFPRARHRGSVGLSQ